MYFSLFLFCFLKKNCFLKFRRLYFFLFLLNICTLSSIRAQDKQWEKTFGGDKDERLQTIISTPDGAYLIGGSSSSSISGNKSEINRGDSDYWVVKVDANGNKLWDKTFGGSGDEVLTALIPTADKGFLLAGYSDSGIGADKSQKKQGLFDYWIVKVDAKGTKMWDRTYGGTDLDYLATIVPSSDDTYLLAGYSFSGRSGDKSEPNRNDTIATSDYWLVKIDAGGNKLWDKTFGGSANDGLQDVMATSDGGYLLGGFSESGMEQDKSQISQGRADYWLLKMNQNGQKIWDKSYGGNDDDLFSSLVATTNGCYLLRGLSDSEVSGEKSEASLAQKKYWVVQINSKGNKDGDKTMEPREDDNLWAMIPTPDGGYLMGGESNATISPGTSADSSSNTDYRLVKLAPPVASPANLNRANITEESTATEGIDLLVYPNPTIGQPVTVAFTVLETQPVSIKLYDPQSREVGTLYWAIAQAGQKYETSWSAGQQGAGTYILVLRSPGKVKSRKLIVTK